MSKKFYDVQASYYMILDKYESNNIKTTEEINKLNTEMKNEVKRVNFLKSAGLKTCIHKYQINMKFLGYNIEEQVTMKEEVIEKIEVKNREFVGFLDFIKFYNKNSVQKFFSKKFRVKKYKKSVEHFSQEIDKIIKQREEMIEEKKRVIEETKILGNYLKDLLRCIEKAEISFCINKHSILNSQDNDGKYNVGLLSNSAWKSFEDYNNAIVLLTDIINNQYINWHYNIDKDSEIIEKINELKDKKLVKFNIS